MTVAKIVANNAKIAALQALNVTLQAAVDTALATEAIVGDSITFTYGRGERAGQRTGVVLARKHQDKLADLIKVQVGSGFDTDIVTIYPNAIISVNRLTTSAD
jgi:hypothetical protein